MGLAQGAFDRLFQLLLSVKDRTGQDPALTVVLLRGQMLAMFCSQKPCPAVKKSS